MAETSLTKTARAIKSELAIFLLIFISVSLIAYLVISYTRKPEDKTSGLPYKENIFPGQTTKSQVESQLGKPSEADTNSFTYTTTNQFRNNKIEFENDTVSIIKEQVIGKEEGTLDDFLNNLGPEEAILYGQHSTYAPAFFWGNKGVIVFANQFDKTIVEIWYFKPTTQEEFLIQHPDFSAAPESHSF